MKILYEQERIILKNEKKKNYQVLFPILLWNLMWSPALTK